MRGRKQRRRGENRVSSLPEKPEGVSLIVWIAALAAGYDAGNAAKVATVLDLFTEARKAVEGERTAETKSAH